MKKPRPHLFETCGAAARLPVVFRGVELYLPSSGRIHQMLSHSLIILSNPEGGAGPIRV